MTEAIVFFWIVFTIIVTAIGDKRRIGAITTFFVCLILSPIVGFIAVMDSPKKADGNVATNKAVKEIDYTEQLTRLNDLRKDGALTEEEFNSEKQKLLAKQ